MKSQNPSAFREMVREADNQGSLEGVMKGIYGVAQKYNIVTMTGEYSTEQVRVMEIIGPSLESIPGRDQL